jgi:hypothetical protein
MFETGFPSHWSTIKKLIWLRMILSSGGSTGQYVTVTGSSPLALVNSLAHAIHSLTQYGKCVQNGTPTPTAPVDIVCNNGVLRYSAQMANVTEQTARVGYYINAQGAVLADQYNWFYQAYIPVKPNTTYTLSMSAPVYYVTISEYSTAEDSGFVVRKTGSTGGNTSLTITTGANTNFIRFGANLNRVAVSLEMVLAINWMLNIGGTAMDYQPYVKGGIYTDGTDEVLTVSGKNLFDKTDSSLQYSNRSLAATTDGYWFYAEGSYSLACPCLPNTQYTISGINQSASFFRVATIDVDTLPDQQDTYRVPYSYIYRATQSEVHTFVTPSTAKWIVVQVNSATYDSTLNTIQIEQGSTATDYEPYHAPQTVTDVPMLLSVGDAKDALELISGHADRAITVFRVSPNLNWMLATGSGYKQFYAADTPVRLKNNVSCMSNIAPYGCTAANRASYQHGCYTGGTGNLCFQMIGEADINTVDDWKAFLLVNGVYVVAVKAAATTEQTTPHSLHTVSGTTIVEAQTNVDPVELSVEYYASQAPGFGLGNPNADEPSGGGEETE